jgi:hypothetical protein
MKFSRHGNICNLKAYKNFEDYARFMAYTYTRQPLEPFIYQTLAELYQLERQHDFIIKSKQNETQEPN